MWVRWILAALHLLALGIGLGAIVWRARSLRGVLDQEGLRRLFFTDTLWGMAALLWISTGLVRAFAGLEKGTAYYLSSNAFWIKMTMLAIVLLLEVWPAITFVQWRIRLRRDGIASIDTHPSKIFAAISTVQALIVVVMVFAATAMARGIG